MSGKGGIDDPKAKQAQPFMSPSSGLGQAYSQGTTDRH